MTHWNFADCWEAIAVAQPEKPAQIHGTKIQSWGQFNSEAHAVAAEIAAAGLGPQAKVGVCLYNGPEYLVSYFAAFKAALVPFNINYRYGVDELAYLLRDADAEAVIFHASFAPIMEILRSRLPGIVCWIAVEDSGSSSPTWSKSYADIVSAAQNPVAARIHNRSPGDLMLLYTGGTTGMPKGVMWRQSDLFNAIGAGGNGALDIPPAESFTDLIARISSGAFFTQILVVACPLMHGTGQFSAFVALNAGGVVVTLTARKFEATSLWDDVERLAATSIVIVGQAFATPMLEDLEAGRPRNLSSVRNLTSSGAMWSQESKRRMLEFMPDAVIFDGLGSSEAVGVGASASKSGEVTSTSAFHLGPNCAVFTEDDKRVEPGTGERGMLAVTGFIPVGYYNDPEKTASTFREIEGKRWSIPGDWAEVSADGTLKLLGRGSVCINTGGEKVYPEEVEEAVKTHGSVRDAIVVGIPDARFGERICAIVELEVGRSVGLSELADHVRGQLAGYKVPREILFLPTIGRAPNGKADYKALSQQARSAFATSD